MSTQGDAFLRSIEEFNNTGTFDAVYELMHEDFIVHTSGGAEVRGRDEARKALEALRDQRGWIRQDVISSTAAAGWLVTIYRNSYTNGHSATGTGNIRMDGDGRVMELWGHVHEG